MDEFPDHESENTGRRRSPLSGATFERLRRGPAVIRSLMIGLAPRRPIVLIQSDDWGRVGAPSLEAIDNVRRLGFAVSASPWNHYGLETEEDVLLLGDMLASARDRDGRSARMTANFILANPDLSAMRSQGLRSLLFVPIRDGFPHPWVRNLMPAYLSNISNEVFYPGLHGFTHFNGAALLRFLSEASETGDRARALVENDIPYMASLTPEYNFALVRRNGAERFISRAEQSDWIEKGVDLFQSTFGFSPRTTCAPGYRANDTTFDLWAEKGIEAVQANGPGLVKRDGNLLVIQRNVAFEPVLTDGDVVDVALRQATRAVRGGFPIVICSHSLNFITPHIGRAAEGRLLLERLLRGLLELFPSLRFASDAEFLDSMTSVEPEWWREPTRTEIAHRLLNQVREL